MERRATGRWPLAAGVPCVPRAADVDLEQQTLATLDAVVVRLGQIINVDRATPEKFGQLSARMIADTDLLTALKDRLTDASGAPQRRELVSAGRTAAYKNVFESIIAEEHVLNDLYSPIKTRLDASPGTLNKLAFSVQRTADLKQWALAGEAFVDLRETGPFKGRGRLLEHADKHLRQAWEKGSAQDVSDAMQDFRANHDQVRLASSRFANTDPVAHRAWLKAFAKSLYSTDHLSVRYLVDYDGTDIRNLSPGTRGIVLLLLYLAMTDY